MPSAACGFQMCGGRSHRYASLDPPAKTWRHRCYRWHRFVFVVPVAAAVAIFSLQVLPPLRNGGADAPRANTEAAAGETSFAAAVDGVKVHVCNSYDDGTGMGILESLERRPNKSDGFAEPYRATTLQIEAWPGKLQAVESEEFRWEINGEIVGVGVTLETFFETVGIHQCTVTSHPDGGRHEFEVTVKYVRREIRDLTDRDRETFFNAVSVLQRVPSVVGREIYGDKYYSMDYFTRMHLYGGGDKTCDHWHDGTGFMNAHMGFTLMFEQALQSVNPSIAVPYWDFTIEGTPDGDSPSFRSSPVFSDDWFGTTTPENGARVPDRGRFGFVPVMTNASEYSRITNAYGMLRSVWNSDSTPFMTRYDGLFGYHNNRKPAGCKQYRDALDHDDWMSFSAALGTSAHGHIHEIVGGAWSMEAGVVAKRTTDRVLPFLHVIYTKKLWRADYLVCPESCSNNAPAWMECQCSCDATAMAGKSPLEVLKDAGLLSGSSFFYDKHLKLIENLDEATQEGTLAGYTAEESEDIFHEALRVMCTPSVVGTFYEATSTIDPIFWVIHPTIERLWQLRRLQDDAFDDTWVPSEFVCFGHNPGDTLPFHDMFASSRGASSSVLKASFLAGVGGTARHGGVGSGQGETGIGLRGGRITGGMALSPKKYYTNAELYHLLDPNGDEVPYVYDNFEWPHCDEKGIHMG
ncbi:unnamed protein product [Ectocarpus sp. 6 AP-2014]